MRCRTAHCTFRASHCRLSLVAPTPLRAHSAHLVDGLLRFLTTAHGGEGENDGDDTFAHNGL